jgi:PAS domain S-box-containing protein
MITSSHKAPPLILVVDDDESMRLELRQAMEKVGYQVAEASDSKQAIAAYTRLHPDIVLLDTTMPLMDGFSCCTQLQRLGGDRIPILMLTEVEEGVERVFAAGASDYITKPIQWTVLHQRVRRLLQACSVTEELQQHEQQLRSVLDSAAIGTWDWDILNNKVVYSATTAVNFGLVPGSFDGTYQSLISSVHPEDRELAITGLHRATEEKTDYNVEFRVIWPDGSIHWLASKGQVDYDHTGSVALRVVGINIDITDRKQIEAIARVREEQADFLENGSIGLHWVGSDGQILWANQAELDLTGYSKEEYIGQSIAKFHADQEVIDDILRRLKAKETLHDYEARLVCKDGSIKYVSINSNVLWQDEQFIHTRCFTRDISARKQAEEKLQRSEEFLQRIIKSSPDCIKVLDLEGRLLYISAGGQALLEIDDLSSFINLEWVSFWQETYNQTARNALETAKAGGTGKFQGYCPTAKGTPKWWEVVVTPLLDAEGKPEKLLSISRDISERKQAEEALRESEQQLKLALQTAKLGSWQLDLQTGELSSSDQCKANFGLPPETELSYDALFERIHAEDRAYVRKSVNLALEQHTDYEVEYRNIWQDGSVHWLLARGRGIYRSDGSPARVIGVTLDITERKQSEKKLQQTITLQRAILESANYTIISTSIDGTILTFNPAAEKWLGYTAAEIVGKTTPIIIHDWDEVVQRSQELSQKMGVHIEPGFEVFVTKARYGEPDEQEWSYIRKDGSRLSVLLSVTRLVDAESNITGFLGIGSDITERKLAQKKLAESENLLSSIIESESECVKLLAADGKLLRINPAGLAMLEADSPAQILGQQIYPLVHPQHRLAFEALTASVFQGECGALEFEIVGIKGTHRWLETHAVPLSNADDEIIALLGVTRDITERKLAADQLERQNRRSQLFADITLKIRQSLEIEEILQTTVTEVQKLLQVDRVLIFRLLPDGNGQIVTEAVVPQWPSVVGQHITDEYFASEYLQKYHQGRIYTIDDIEKANVPLCLIEFMQQFGVKAKLVMPILLKEEVWGLLIAHQCSSPRKWTTSEIELLQQLADQIGIALAQAQLLEQETRQRQELTRSNEELQQFASIASHDLQEPLRKIQAFGNRLKEKYSEELTDQGRDYLERMQNAAQRMQALIEDLLILSRITTKAQPFVAVNLAQITQEVLSDLEVRIQQTEGRVEVGELPTINADPLQMRQLLQNLIGNALKFHRDKEQPIVKINAQLFKDQQPIAKASSANICQITVEDNGIGFDEKYLDRIFNVFQRLQGRNQYEGTGMGLAICRKIVERHGGSITAESNLGRGAKFIVTLPINNLALTET